MPDGTFEPALPRPANLDAWSQDAIQAIVAKYVDPGVQCRVSHRAAAPSGNKHPLIAVPGGHRVPVRAKAGSPDGKKLMANRVYIRRPGPNSEEPRSAEEWDRFFERCLQNLQAELLDAMRSIMAGVIPTTAPATPTRIEQLAAFESKAIARWKARVAALPADAAPRFKHGFYEVGFAIDGAFERKSLADLREIVQSAVRNHSGWPPFLTINRPPFTPKPCGRCRGALDRTRYRRVVQQAGPPRLLARLAGRPFVHETRVLRRRPVQGRGARNRLRYHHPDLAPW